MDSFKTQLHQVISTQEPILKKIHLIVRTEHQEDEMAFYTILQLTNTIAELVSKDPYSQLHYLILPSKEIIEEEYSPEKNPVSTYDQDLVIFQNHLNCAYEEQTMKHIIILITDLKLASYINQIQYFDDYFSSFVISFKESFFKDTEIPSDYWLLLLSDESQIDALSIKLKQFEMDNLSNVTFEEPKQKMNVETETSNNENYDVEELVFEMASMSKESNLTDESIPEIIDEEVIEKCTKSIDNVSVSSSSSHDNQKVLTIPSTDDYTKIEKSLPNINVNLAFDHDVEIIDDIDEKIEEIKTMEIQDTKHYVSQEDKLELKEGKKNKNITSLETEITITKPESLLMRIWKEVRNFFCVSTYEDSTTIELDEYLPPSCVELKKEQ